MVLLEIARAEMAKIPSTLGRWNAIGGGRVWGLPFLTALAPSERHASDRQRRHKKLTDWARQLLLQTARWLPNRHIIGAADSSYEPLPTFSDALALVRCELWTQPGFDTSAIGYRLAKIPQATINALIGAACYVA